jgi:hypothetical protein
MRILANAEIVVIKHIFLAAYAKLLPLLVLQETLIRKKSHEAM